MSKEIPDKIIELSKQIEDSLKNDKNNIIERNPGEIYEKTLPDGITIDVVDQIQNHNADFVAAGVLSFHNIAMRQMTEDKECTEMSGKIKMGYKSNVQIDIEREHPWKDHLHGGEDKVSYGATTVKLVTHGDKKTTQPLKTVMDEISRISLEQLGKAPF